MYRQNLDLNTSLVFRLNLSYWQSLRWLKVDRHVAISELDVHSFESIKAIVSAAVNFETNDYSILITDLKERFDSCDKYITENGTYPITPILLNTNDGLKILDGNHRMAAYFYRFGYFLFDENICLNTKEIQSYWIAIKPDLD